VKVLTVGYGVRPVEEPMPETGDESSLPNLIKSNKSFNPAQWL
jgi:hypothetical protein